MVGLEKSPLLGVHSRESNYFKQALFPTVDCVWN